MLVCGGESGVLLPLCATCVKQVQLPVLTLIWGFGVRCLLVGIHYLLFVWGN